ncbi:MAG: type I-D CRISPR-associated protein Cas7/Csc2 [Pseudomonadota bacterium]
MKALFSELRTEVKTTYDITVKPFDIPALPKAQCIVIPVVREAIAPLIIRNNDADMITDIELANELRVRMIASKTKGVERRRGSQILRSFGLGGRAAANKAYVKDKPSDVFDLNTFVFGDSATGGKSKKSIYPVHAAVLYSDAISVQPYDLLIDDVFRQGGISEEYVSYDPEKQKTSSNIFTTRSVRPGALFIQTLVMLGHRITKESFNHLLLSIGLAGSYGGATATTGTNLKTHLAGVYWGKIERSINAPSQLLEKLETDSTAAGLVEEIPKLMQEAYPHHIEVETLNAHVQKLIADFESVNNSLKNDYENAAVKMRELFDAWFKQDKTG